MLVDAPREVIWKALIDPHINRLYMPFAMMIGDSKRGSTVRWYETTEGKQVLRAKGTLMAFDPGRRLRYTFYLLDGGLPDDPSSHVTVDLRISAEPGRRTAVHLWMGDFAGLPHAVRRAREAGKVWVEMLVGLKREAEQEAGSIAA